MLFSLEINNGKRVEESMILKKLINKKKYSIKDLSIDMKERFKNKVSEQTIESCINNLNFKFIRKEFDIVKIQNGDFHIGRDLLNLISCNVSKIFLDDSTTWSIKNYSKNYNVDEFFDGFVLHNKYSKMSVEF